MTWHESSVWCGTVQRKRKLKRKKRHELGIICAIE